MPSRRAWIVIGLLAVVLVSLRLPVVDSGLHMDDLAQRAMVEGHYPVPRAPWDLYTFSTGDPAEVQSLMRAGALPWWSDSELRLSALRPLASGLVWLDAVALSPEAAHVHSLLWWVVMLGALGWALVPVLGGRWTGLVVVLYGLDDAHAMPLAWLANRAAILSGVFGWLALGVYVRGAQGARARAPALTVCSAMSMAAGEYGLSSLAYVVAYALVVDRRPSLARVRALLPVLLPVMAYLVVHRAGGYGAEHSAIYVDPAAEPRAFAGALFERGPRLILDMATGTPLQPLEDWSTLGVWAAAVAAVGLLVGLSMWRRPEHRGAVGWAVLGATLAVIPVSASFLSERLTVLASVGAHVLTAGVVLAAARGVVARDVSTRAVATALAAAALLYGHVVVATRSSWAKVETVRRFNEAGQALAEAMPVEDARAPQERWVLLAAGDTMTLIYPPHLRARSGHPRPAAFTVLTLARGPLAMTRPSSHAIEITSRSGFLRTPLERFFRSDDRPLPDVVGWDGLRVEVVERAEGVPHTLRFTFDRPLEDPQLRFMSVGTRGVFRYPLARPGAAMPLAPGVHAILTTPRAAPTP